MTAPTTNRRPLRALAAAVVLAPMAIGATPAFAEDAPAPSETSYQEALTQHVMTTQDVSEDEAKDYLKAKDSKLDSLAQLIESGTRTDGAWFDGTTLHVVVKDSDVKAAEKAGLTPETGPGHTQLVKRGQEILDGAGDLSGDIVSVAPDVKSGSVKVAVAEGASDEVTQKLRAMGDDVEVTTAPQMELQVDVIPGQDMNMVGGGGCSLGFTGKTAEGKNVLITAGHCIEGASAVNDKNNQLIGKPVENSFKTGAPGQDMGLVELASGAKGQPYVDSRGARGNVDVVGMDRNPIGTELCKSGRTTGWTCGEITAYGETVNYGGNTRVDGLASSTVCTEPGDSGGAYIGANGHAQGMTSGGPVGQECSPNQNGDSMSYFQPVGDAAKRYGVTLDTTGSSDPGNPPAGDNPPAGGGEPGNPPAGGGEPGNPPADDNPPADGGDPWGDDPWGDDPWGPPVGGDPKPIDPFDPWKPFFPWFRF